MSGLAEILIKEGFTISGSDIHTSDIIKHLEDKGAKVYLSQTADNITDDIDLVVYTAAINFDTNEEYKEAIRRNIPVMKRATLLGQMMHNYQNAIAVSGTHGKTTTTSMLSYILLAGNTDPTISVGGILDAINGNIRVGHSETFVTEACEYTNSFLEFFPKISIILNIEEDHMDFFKDLDDIRHSFREFAHKLPDYGYLIINGEIENIDYIVDGLKAEYATFGLENDSYDYCAKNIGYDAFGHAHFDYYYKGEFIDHIQLNVNGEHNVKNALAAIAAAKRIGIDVDTMKKGLLGFTGAKRRFELKGTCNDFTVVDDYAHHPTEIRATLESAKNYPHNELWCVFQPHTYSRTIAFLDDFAKALSLCDHVIVTDIYAAREKDTGIVSSKDIVDRMADYDVDVHYIKEFDDIEKFILKNCKKNDLLITNSGVLNALINPVGPDFSDSKYQIYLMNSQNNSQEEANFVISKIEQNKTAKPLTRATEAKVNRGVYDLTVTLKDGLNLENALPADEAYAFCTKDAWNNEIISAYDVKIKPEAVTSATKLADAAVSAKVGEVQVLDDLAAAATTTPPMDCLLYTSPSPRD